MPQLLPPTVDVRASFLAAMDEFHAEGDRISMSAKWIEQFGDSWHTEEGFARFVATVKAQAGDRSSLPERWVLTTTLWWVDGAEYLGRISLRHELNEFLRELGGHIGYDVRRTARRRGHATKMLRAMLAVAHGLGIDPALVTCDDTNVASRKVIESCGGVLEDQRESKLRFWVPTGA